jgi:hypothetical protein
MTDLTLLIDFSLLTISSFTGTFANPDGKTSAHFTFTQPQIEKLCSHSCRTCNSILFSHEQMTNHVYFSYKA